MGMRRKKKEKENEHKVISLIYAVPRLRLIHTYYKQNLSVTLATKFF